MTKLILSALAAVMLLVPAAAQARPFEAAEEAAYTEAVAWWGEEPVLCGSIDKGVESVGGDWGYATQPSAFEPTCFLRIDPEVLGYYGMLCEVMRHEVGHLLGHGHVDDPTNIMDPVLSPEAAPECFPPQTPTIAPEDPAAAPEESPVETTSPGHGHRRHKHRRHRRHDRRRHHEASRANK